jgi:opacity protein-like surface antigen
VTAVAAFVGMLVSSAALAASPRQIYADFADNGRFDATYARADLEAALRNATLGGYEDSGTVGRMKTEIKKKLGGGAPAGAQEDLSQTGAAGGALPFTGFDLALIVGGAVFLLALGGGLRRVARTRA